MMKIHTAPRTQGAHQTQRRCVTIDGALLPLHLNDVARRGGEQLGFINNLLTPSAAQTPYFGKTTTTS